MGQKPVTQQPRKRQLNVVYFVDSSRTRSFRIPLRRLNVLLALFLGVVTWSIASVGLIIYMAIDRAEVSDRLHQSLAVIFDYETRYDGVYEKAYPLDGRLVALADQDSGDVSEDPDVEDMADARSESVEGDDREDPVSQVEEEPETTAAAVDPEPAPEKEPAPTKPDEISVADPVVEELADDIQIRFRIENQNTPQRVGGHVWGVAEFRDATGAKTYIGAPSAIGVTDDGNVSHKERSHQFSIKHYKVKEFSFPLPKDRTGTITAIHIGVQYSSGKEDMFDVPVDIKVGVKAAEEPEADQKSG